MEIKIKRISENAVVPTRKHKGDAGVDLHACMSEPVNIYPKSSVMFPTGIAVAIPYGYVGLVHPRSGLSNHKLLIIPNSPGTIDAGYRGEIIVAIYNVGDLVQTVQPNDRIAQLIIQKVELPDFVEVEELDNTSRGNGGFGSTGN